MCVCVCVVRNTASETGRQSCKLNKNYGCLAWAIFVLNIVILFFTLCLSLSLASRLNPELSNHLPNFSLKRTLKFPPPLCASHPCHMIFLFSSDLLRQTSLKNGPHMRTQICSQPRRATHFWVWACSTVPAAFQWILQVPGWTHGDNRNNISRRLRLPRALATIRHWIMPLMCLIFKTKVG